MHGSPSNPPELADQNGILRACLEGLDAPVFAVDSQYRYTSFNGVHAAIMRALYSAEIELGQCLLDYQTVAADRTKAKVNLDRALKGEVVIEEAYSGDAPQARLYFEVAHRPIRTANGKCVGVVVIAKDITKRKQALDALVESEGRFQALFEQAGVGIGEVDSSTGRYLQVNQCYCDIVGYTKAELLASSYQPLTHPEDLAASLALMAALRDGRIRDAALEKRYIRKDGKVVWVNLRIAKVTLGPTTPGSHISVVQDITAQKASEQQLRESYNLVQDLLDYSPALIFLVDLEGRFLRINKQLEKVLHRDRNEVLGQTRAAVLPQEVATAHERNDRLVVASGVAHVFEETNQEAGDERTYLSMKFPLLDGAGKPYAVCGIATDITARKRAEKAVESQLEELHRWYAVTLSRESRILELKREVNELQVRLGQPPRYGSVCDDAADEPSGGRVP